MAQPLRTKPGNERSRFRPDVILKFSVDGSARLLEFLMTSMPGRKRTTIKDYLKHNQVMVNGNISRQFDLELKNGDEVNVNTSREFQVFRNPRLHIIYEDDDIIVVNKGYGLLSMATDRKKDGTAYSLLRDYLKRKDPGNKLFIVHRLDQHTSGLMMFAKTMEAKETMQHNWNNMVLERTYVAVIEGRIDPPAGTIRSYLTENSRHEVYSTENPEEGQLAITRYTTIKSRGGYSLVELSLDTGRKNQIRVHMKDMGTPVTGDRRYGAKTGPIHRLALHARTLRFVHPVTRKDMNFSTPIPASFSRII